MEGAAGERGEMRVFARVATRGRSRVNRSSRLTIDSLLVGNPENEIVWSKSKVASGRRSSSGRRRVLALVCASWFVFGFASPTKIQSPISEFAIGYAQDFRVTQRVVEESKKPRLVRTALRKSLDLQTARRQPASRIFSPGTDALYALKGFERQSASEMVTGQSTFHRPADDRLVGVPPKLAALVNNDGADVLATAYAPNDEFHASPSPFAALLGPSESTGRFVPPVMEGDHEWMKQPLPASVFSSQEQKCLATAIYFEARGEKVRGQAAVAQVILNRVRNPAYPASVCDVVYQNDDWANKCQFSFACDGAPDIINDRRAYRLAKDVAMAVTGGKIFLPDVASSTHYNATYVNPSWARAMERMTQIGSHIFYRTYGGGWS